MATHVWLRHSETGGEWECPNDEAVLRYYTARGWEPFEPVREEESVPSDVTPVTEPAPKKRTTK